MCLPIWRVCSGWLLNGSLQKAANSLPQNGVNMPDCILKLTPEERAKLENIRSIFKFKTNDDAALWLIRAALKMSAQGTSTLPRVPEEQ